MENNSTSITESTLKFIQQKYPNIALAIVFWVCGYNSYAYMNPDNNQATRIDQQTIVTTTNNITRAEYTRLDIGMELVEVEAILGRGIEISSSNDTATYIWQNPDRSYIKAVFKEDKLYEKTQDDLK